MAPVRTVRLSLVGEPEPEPEPWKGYIQAPPPVAGGSLSLLRTFSRPGGSRESCWLQGQHLGGEVDSRGEWAPDRVLFLKGQAGCVSAHGAGSTGASRASLL